MSEQTASSPAAGNRLGASVSPYLQQHRDNPVHWREWSAETLAEARALDRPILLSIGYAACHWCHVMAHESFEDAETADLMNRRFVNVKVDREERPDIDTIYMTALQAMGEQGGWPMTMFLTPDGAPFFGGTYYPPRPAHGRPSFRQLLEAVGTAWQNRRAELDRSAAETRARLTAFLSAVSPEGTGDEALAPDIPGASAKVGSMLDMRLGGMRGAPKFPNAPYMELVARGAFPNGPQALREGFLLTLRQMCLGGIYDHLGGGLARYSTDERWLVPHFEKMLYDNAQFLRHLVWGWRATGSALFRRRIEETVAWLGREMRVGAGALAASLDADSLDEHGHAHEGAFYVWRADEIDAVLGERGADFRQAYGVSADGNFEGRNILHRLGSADAEADHFAAERAALLAARDGRPRPGRDDKMLADWNGLAIRALAEVATVFGDTEALPMAKAAFADVKAALTLDGRLRHAGRDGRAARGFALSSDYGALIAAAVQLFAATGDGSYLAEARRLAAELERWHGDGAGGHALTAADGADVILRPRGDGDDAIPGGTALVLEGLALLAEATGDPALLDRAETAARAALARTREQGGLSPAILSACDTLERASQLVMLGERSDETFAAMRGAANGVLDLARLDVVPGPGAALPPELPLAAVRPERRPAAYLCAERACRPPVFDAASLAELLRPAAENA
ncbi:thioredoxin domain-containing protein [Aureimonas leprariae]|uniref:Thioredoxin domain-containing protein n=1 Tax=Plantimonas leprariae TaxID=2615207 RepID=A0A7V7TW00_9HYPH|nr:thioredoxin domain-containing protein [Aureimonas leprariae]KAB0679354.1 thioredoxin domain-containing protein [Aureimonas leprariae]